MVGKLPAQLVEGLSAADRLAVEVWWAGLPDVARYEVEALCDERLDRCFFGVGLGGPGDVVPRVIGGRFLPDDDAAGWEEWYAAYFDDLVNRSEFEPMLVRTFYIGGMLAPSQKMVGCPDPGVPASDLGTMGWIAIQPTSWYI